MAEGGICGRCGGEASLFLACRLIQFSAAAAHFSFCLSFVPFLQPPIRRLPPMSGHVSVRKSLPPSFPPLPPIPCQGSCLGSPTVRSRHSRPKPSCFDFNHRYGKEQQEKIRRKPRDTTRWKALLRSTYLGRHAPDCRR